MIHTACSTLDYTTFFKDALVLLHILSEGYHWLNGSRYLHFHELQAFSALNFLPAPVLYQNCFSSENQQLEHLMSKGQFSQNYFVKWPEFSCWDVGFYAIFIMRTVPFTSTGFTNILYTKSDQLFFFTWAQIQDKHKSITNQHREHLLHPARIKPPDTCVYSSTLPELFHPESSTYTLSTELVYLL